MNTAGPAASDEADATTVSAGVERETVSPTVISVRADDRSGRAVTVRTETGVRATEVDGYSGKWAANWDDD